MVASGDCLTYRLRRGYFKSKDDKEDANQKRPKVKMAGTPMVGAKTISLVFDPARVFFRAGLLSSFVIALKKYPGGSEEWGQIAPCGITHLGCTLSSDCAHNGCVVLQQPPLSRRSISVFDPSALISDQPF
jgi:hypothetical protein